MAIELCRHGARSPNSPSNVTGATWPEGIGMLTEKGKSQHFNIGRDLRQRYIDDYGLLDSVYSPYQLLV